MSRKFTAMLRVPLAFAVICSLAFAGIFSNVHAANVQAANVQAANDSSEIGLDAIDCVIYPSLEADIGSNSAGVLETILVDRSDFIAQGDIIASLESSAEQSAVVLARARANAAAEVGFRKASANHSSRQYARIEQLDSQSVVSNQDLDDRKTEVELGKFQLRKAIESQNLLALELKRAEKLLGKRTIRSPFSGVVVERFKTVGEYIDSDPVVRIAQLHPLHVETIIPAEHIGKIIPGMQADIKSVAHPDKNWSARVDRVDSVVDVASATFGVRLVLQNPKLEITAGLRCQLSFTVSYEPDSSVKPLPLAVMQGYTEYESLKKSLSAIHNEQTQLITVPEMSAAMGQNGRPGKAIEIENSAASTSPDIIDSFKCGREGPYPDRISAERRAGLWETRAVNVKIVSRSRIVNLGQLVLSPLFQTRDAANTYVASLKAAGVSDYFLPKKITPVRVSVGAFRQKGAAELLVQRLSTNKISSELHPWQKSHKGFYLVNLDQQNGNTAVCESTTGSL